MKRETRPVNVFPFATATSDYQESAYSSSELVLISVILPAYNHGGYLRESIDSILAQDVPLELIVVDDGSTDDTAEILATYHNEPRVTAIAQANAGLPRALNRGFAEARGSLLTWTSADNRYLPGALGRMKSFLAANPGIDLVYANVRLIDDEGRSYCGSRYRSDDQCSADSSLLLLPTAAATLSELNDNFINACFLFRRDLLLYVGEHNPAFLGFEDYDYWLRASLAGKIAHLDSADPLYEYRLHRNSLTGSLTSESLSRRQAGCVEAVKKARKFLSGRLSFQLAAPKAEDSEQCLQTLNHCLRAAGHDTAVQRVPGETIVRVAVEALPASALIAREFRGSGSRPSMRQERFGPPDASPHPLALAPLPKQPPERSMPDMDDERPWGAVLLPPLEIPPVVRRARDGSRGAVAAGPNARGVVFVFAPEIGASKGAQQAVNFAAALLPLVPQLTFAFYCETPAQRRFCDGVNLALHDNRNLRIVDVSEECESADRSLMYVLSSSDLLLNLSCLWPLLGDGHSAPLRCSKLHADLIAALLDLRAESALAAAAGLPVVSALPHFSRKKSVSATWAGLAAAVGGTPDAEAAQKALLASLIHAALEPPHHHPLAIADWEDRQLAFQPAASSIAEHLTQAARSSAAYSFNSAEQWLERLTAHSAGQRLAAGLFCRSLSPAADAA